MKMLGRLVFRLVQFPSAAIISSAGLLGFPEPGLPPVAVMYTCVSGFVQLYSPVMVKLPLLSLTGNP